MTPVERMDSGNARDNAYTAANEMKETLGAPLTKEVILHFAKPNTRLADVPADQYQPMTKLMREMLPMSHDAAREHFRNFVAGNESNCDENTTGIADNDQSKAPYAGKTISVTVPLSLSVPHITPNEIIAALLDIAAKAERLVKRGVSNTSAEQMQQYHALADAFAPLQQLQDTYSEGPAMAALRHMRSFLEGSATIRVDADMTALLDSLRTDAASGQHGTLAVVNEVFPVRNYDDTYVHTLLTAVADIASDGKRFRTLMWVAESAHELGLVEDAAPEDGGGYPVLSEEDMARFAPYKIAEVIMDSANPTTLEQMRAALDAVMRAGVVPDTPKRFIDTAQAHEKLRQEAFTLAQHVESNYEDNHGRCIYCETVVEDMETIDEKHAANCAVTLARQIIENEGE